jgi:DUF4097 and DUF4098 domain-containing protein YvlB
MSNVGWDFNALDTGDYVDKEFILTAEQTGALRSVSIATTSTPVEIRTLNDSHPTTAVYYTEDENNRNTEITFENGELTVKQKYKFNIKDLSIINGWNFKDIKITIYLPENFDKIEIKVGSGTVTADGLSVDNFSVDINSGRANLHSVTAENLTLDIDSGRIALDGITATKITADVNSGSVTLDKVTVTDLSVKIDSGSFKGEITGNQDDYTIMVSIGSGFSNLKNQQGTTDRHIKIDINSGSSKISFA